MWKFLKVEARNTNVKVQMDTACDIKINDKGAWKHDMLS